METKASTLPSDWDQPFTDQELQAIVAAFQSASSSSSIKSPDTGNSTGDCAEQRPKTRRRLPDSLSGSQQQHPFTGNSSSTFSLAPCPRNWLNKICLSTHQAKSMMRYPKITFGGKIVYSRTVSEVEKASEELLKFVEAKKRGAGHTVLGFDIEWKPTFKRGVKPGKAAVMQICGDKSHCHVMHIIHTGIPQKLRSLLEDPTSVKVGVSIANDATKVFRDHKVSVEALEDLSKLANQKLGGDSKSWSLGSLTEMLICKKLPKPSHIRVGNWEAAVLSEAQLQYAATDAFASWYIYEALKKLPDPVDNKSEKPESVAQHQSLPDDG